MSVVGSGTLLIGQRCRLGRNVHFDTSRAGRIVLGDRVRINTGSVIAAEAGVSVGDDSLIGEYVSIRDANHGTSPGAAVRTQALMAAEIRIGRDVWIGRGCCILKGVCIEDGAVIGANSVVTRDVAANTICVGSPAHKIGDRA